MSINLRKFQNVIYMVILTIYFQKIIESRLRNIGRGVGNH